MKGWMMKIKPFFFRIAVLLAAVCIVLPVQAGKATTDSTGDSVDRMLQILSTKSDADQGYAMTRALYLLSSGKKTQVSNKTKELIGKLFDQDVNKETILLAGFAGVNSAHDQISYWAHRPIPEPDVGSFFGTNEWAANLVLARQGDADSIEKLLDTAHKQDLHTLVVFVLVDFQYVPQSAIVEFLKQYLDSNERLEPVKSTVEGMPVAYYAASSLARMLKGFPVDYREDYSYSMNDIQKCRAWMSRQKEWKFN